MSVMFWLLLAHKIHLFKTFALWGI